MIFDILRRSIRTKLALLITGSLIIVLVVGMGICFTSFQKELRRLANENQEARIRIFWDLLKQKGTDMHIENGKLMIDNYIINDNFELPDKLKALCGGTATVFMHDMRVSTNVMKEDGTRAVGTKLKGVAYDAVFRDHRPYRGEADILGVPYFTAYDPITDKAGNIIGVLYTGIKKTEFFNAYEQIKSWIILVLTVFTIAICVLMHFSISIMISKPITTVVESIKAIAEGEGDLTKRIDVSRIDEIGQLSKWLNLFIDYMEHIIITLKHTAGEVDTATNMLASGTQGLSQVTQEQASSIEEVTAITEEITKAIKNNALNADTGRTMAKSMVNMTKASESSSQELIQSMSEISQASKKVGDIVTTVNEVAFQTNLLALNAAVEAARAGEEGKGFAVVAGEVRTLAQRSSVAANEIKNLIQDTVEKVRSGEGIVKKSVESLQDIISHINSLSQKMDEIAESSSEQSTSVDEINRALIQIDSTTQQNASTVEELAGTADTMRSGAKELASIVGQFRVIEDRSKNEWC